MPPLTLSVLLAAQSAAAPRATLSFEPAARLVAGGSPIQLEGQTTPRRVDWDGDGTRDLLIAAGDGKVWLCRGDITQRIASRRLDLPQPLGPTIPVSPS